MTPDEKKQTMPPEELKNGKKRTQKEGLNGVVEKINNERISLMWTYG